MKELMLGNTKITFIFPEITKEEKRKRLKSLYDICNEIFRDKSECFYTDEEVKKLKQDPNSIFL